MDTRKKVPRPPKSKAAPTVVATEIVAPVVAAPVVAAPKRVQVGKAIGINIAVARTRRHLDKLNMNSGPSAYIDALKTQLAPYKVAQRQLKDGKITHLVEKDYQYVKDGKTLTGKKIFEELRDITDAERAAAQKVIDSLAPSVPTWEAKLAAFSRERARFSNESAVVLAVVCDELIQQLVTHSMKTAILLKKKTIQTPHLYGDGVEALPLYPLASGLPLFKFTANHTAKSTIAAAHAAALAAALSQAEKDFKKKHDVHVKRVKKVAEPAADAKPDAAEAEPDAAAETVEEDDNNASFKMYVGQVCKDVASSDEQYKPLRFSTDVRNHLSDLLAEFIQRIASLIAITNSSMNSKTVTSITIMHSVEALLIDGHAKHEEIEVVPAKLVDPEALKVELAAKAAAKAAGNKYKINMETIAKIDGFTVNRTITYPTSGYNAIAKTVKEKLDAFTALPKKVKAELGEPDLLDELVA